ncbi:hypothetical protein ACIBJF_39925 [Streptomyces sp. NPDC050743]|uniref:hypothetical protein n=1 Tax=Streptomyces sp. NPDC050743 TaxID=3365634 RepID=UPI0037A26001
MTAQPSPTAAPFWAWPVDLLRFDRRGLLTEAEAEALRNCSIDEIRRHDLAADLLPLRPAARLVRPLADVLAALHWPPDDRHQRRYARDAAGLVLLRSGELRRAFWGWSVQDWADLINADGAEFRRQWGGQIGPNARPFLIAYAYLLGEFTAFERLGRFMRPSLARRVFGTGPVDAAVEQISTVLADWGYRRSAQKLEAAACQVLLLNRSPRLEDLSTEALAELRESPAMGGQWGNDLHGVHRAVAALGHADPPRSGPAAGPAAMEGVPSGGAGWVERWYATSTLTPKIRRSYRSVLAKIGRWLAAEHPEVTEPGQWTRQTCASWVAAVDRMSVGDFSQWTHGMHSQGRLGKPLTAQSKSGYLKVPRAFFRDLHEWEWTPRRFDPAHALADPTKRPRVDGPGPTSDSRGHLGQTAVGRPEPRTR